MAHKTMHLTQAGVQQYKNRMMVGDPITLSGNDARALERIGWVEEPKRQVRKAEPAIIPHVAEVLSAELVEAPKPAAKKAPARKKAAARK